MRGKWEGYGASLLATMVWAGNFIASRALAFSIPPCQFNFWRWLVAFLAILPFALPHLRAEREAMATHFRYLALMALLGVTLMNTFIYKAGQTTESLNMALLMLATPLLIMLLAWIFYGEAICCRRLWGMLICMAGILVLISRGDWHIIAGLNFRPGDIWALGCMACFAIYSLLMRNRPQELSSSVFNFAIFGLGLVFALPITISEALLLPLPKLSWPVMSGILYSGLGCSALAFWLWTVAIDRIGPVRAGIVYYSMPLFAALMAWLFLGESVNMAQFAGGLLIISGIFTSSISPGKKPPCEKGKTRAV